MLHRRGIGYLPKDQRFLKSRPSDLPSSSISPKNDVVMNVVGFLDDAMDFRKQVELRVVMMVDSKSILKLVII